MKTKYWLIIIGVLILLFGVREFFNQKHTDSLITHIANYKDTVRYEKLKNGAIIAINSSLKLDTDKQIREMASNLNDTVKQLVNQFKKLQSVTYVTNNFTAVNDTIKIDNQIPCDFVPFKISKKDNNYSFTGTLSRTNFVIDTLSVPNNITIVQGRKKTGFLKYEDVIAINNSNPLMVTSNITDYRLSGKKKFLEKPAVLIGVGAIGTILVRVGVQFLINSFK